MQQFQLKKGLTHITGSVPKGLAKPEHPFLLNIYRKEQQQSALSIRLDVFRRADVAWLLSLPDLKVQR